MEKKIVLPRELNEELKHVTSRIQNDFGFSSEIYILVRDGSIVFEPNDDNEVEDYLKYNRDDLILTYISDNIDLTSSATGEYLTDLEGKKINFLGKEWILSHLSKKISIS